MLSIGLAAAPLSGYVKVEAAVAEGIGIPSPIADRPLRSHAFGRSVSAQQHPRLAAGAPISRLPYRNS